MTVPTVVLADAEGKIVGRVEGYDERLGAELTVLARTEESRE
jgi:hypothetical protein